MAPWQGTGATRQPSQRHSNDPAQAAVQPPRQQASTQPLPQPPRASRDLAFTSTMGTSSRGLRALSLPPSSPSAAPPFFFFLAVPAPSPSPSGLAGLGGAALTSCFFSGWKQCRL